MLAIVRRCPHSGNCHFPENGGNTARLERLMKRFAHLTLLALLASGLAPALLPAQRTVTSLQLDSASARLDRFAGTLGAAERALWDGLLRRAASAPAPGRDVRMVAIRRTGAGGACGSSALIDPRPQADHPAFVADLLAGVFQAVIDRSIQQMEAYQNLVDGVSDVVENYRTLGATAPVRNDALVPESPVGRRPDASGVLARRLAELILEVREEERAALEWLLTRAVVAPPARASTKPDPLGPVTLREALGVERRILPRGRAPIATAEAWTLRC
jgi:hypothetical protein